MLEFIKFTGLPGLLGEQFFRALDTNNDGQLDQLDFVHGFITLYKGSFLDTVWLLFHLLDFNHKGYVTPQDMEFALLYLPSRCSKCGMQVDQHWLPADKVRDCFLQKDRLLNEDVVHLMGTQYETFNAILQALLNSMPAICEEALNTPRICATPQSTEALKPMVLNGRRRFFELKHQALYYYNSVDTAVPKGVILVKDLFVEKVEDSVLVLKNLKFKYEFRMENEGERDDWATRICEANDYRDFHTFYEIAEPLGSGSSGKVLKAIHKLTGQVVAVKIVDKQPMGIKNETRLRREIDILRFARHGNLLQLLDVFETAQMVYIVTEFVPQGTLFEWLEIRNFKVSEETAKSLVRDIAQGLEFLHASCIVHRDMKLENILLTEKEGKMKAILIDYGLSCFLGPGQSVNEPVGTLKYAAPEVISRLPYREKVDCWGLGVILHILLVGTLPFYGKTDQEVALRVLKKPICLEGEKWIGVSAPAKELLTKLLARRADLRISASEVLHMPWLLSD